MPTPQTLLAPAATAYPKYAALLSEVAAIIAADAPPPALPTPAAPGSPAPLAGPTARPTAGPTALTAVAGMPLLLSFGGQVESVDFGDSSAPFNSLKGYNAGHVYDTVGTYALTTTASSGQVSKGTVVVTPDIRPQSALAPAADLAQAITQLKQPTVLLLPRGATYPVTAPIVLAQSGVSIRPTGTGALPRIVRVVSPGSASVLVVTGDNCSIEGIEFDSNVPLNPATPATAGAGGAAKSVAQDNGKVDVYAIVPSGKNLLIRNCNFRNVDNGVYGGSKTNGLLMLGCGFTKELRGDAAYFQGSQNIVLLGNTAVGSLYEHIFRTEGNTQFVLIAGGDLSNADGKETITFRQGSYLAVVDPTLHAWLRMSEGSAGEAGQYVHDVLISGVTFAGLYPGGAWIAIDPGSKDVRVEHCTFACDAAQICVAAAGPISGVAIISNTQSVAKGITPKPLVALFNGAAVAQS